jgi:NAD(P)H-hydrate epimerase
VLDADALTLLAAAPDEMLPQNSECLILTPHPGEMARLLGRTSRKIQGNRLAAARELARKWGVHLVLKGAGTIIVDPDGRTAINNSGNQLLATAGAGDLLSGIIGAFLARGAAPGAAARAGVFLHGQLADRLAAAGRSAGITAVELQRELPAALAELEQCGTTDTPKRRQTRIHG